ncbi:Vacuolar protein sorting-associated protein 33A [Chionoecetes opilio]|uniref:Vacuolar protein sorting-associated protein 33A n=1 Tax=Chionoecetes opilio TaxID=41210 RepID=A0A8J5D342_CHIOP|nr:Vacuolar protein sorting-associated protein 33A [Chionoecetes opilio]
MTGGKVDLALVREATRLELVKLLDGIPGTKAIVWDEKLAGPFSQVADYAFLRTHDVCKMYYINTSKLPSNTVAHIIFLTRPHTHLMDLINQQLRMEEALGGGKKDYHLWLVPRVSLLCEQRLEEHGVHGSLASIRELPLLLYRLDSDLASMELPMCFRDLHLDSDPSCLFLVAQALMTLQGVFGLIPNIYGKGTAAKQVYDLMVRMRREMGGNEPQVTPQIDQLILIDRSVDLITPLATQLTYDGLIDQFFTINNCTVKLPGEKFAAQSTTESNTNSNMDNSFSEIKTIQLNSSEELYSEIRDFNFSAVGPRLSHHAKSVVAQYEERHAAKTMGELKQFVQKIPQMEAYKQSVATHTAVAELIQERITKGIFWPALQMEQEFLKGLDTDKVNPFVEQCIAQKESLNTVLRLICLQCTVNNGLKPRVLEHYKRDIIHTYGYHHFLTLENLERAGLLFAHQGRSTYAVVRKTLQLTVDDVRTLCTRGESVMQVLTLLPCFLLYAPLSARLVEFLQVPGWRAITGVLQVLPGPTLTETQQLPSALRHRRGSGGSVQSGLEGSTALVFFIGGCTYSEIAALRFLSSRVDQGGPEYIIATTKIINGDTFLESIADPLPT